MLNAAIQGNSSERSETQFLRLSAIAAAEVHREPYPYLIARNVLPQNFIPLLKRDFPEIKTPGFFPLATLKRTGAFGLLLQDLEGPAIADILSKKLGVELRDKPRMITVRKWSAAKDGRIHNDGEAKIVTSLLYLNEEWPLHEDGGRFRVLRSKDSFDDAAAEVSPAFGTFITFVRTDSSWHGHKPFIGERRVIQTTWLRSWEDLERKEKRGYFSFLMKKLFSSSY